MEYKPGFCLATNLAACSSAHRVAIAVGGFHGDFQRFAEQAEHDGVLAGIVARADGVVADLVVRPLAELPLPAMRLVGLAHHSGDDIAELQRGAARRHLP